MISTYSLALSVDIPEPQRMDVSVGVEVGPSCCGALSKTFWVEVSTSCCGTHFFFFHDHWKGFTCILHDGVCLDPL